MTQFSAIMIQVHPDYTRESGEGIEADASGPDPNGKWSGWISFWRDGRPHISPMVSTAPIYDSRDQAIAEMARVIEDVRKVDILTPARGPESAPL